MRKISPDINEAAAKLIAVSIFIQDNFCSLLINTDILGQKTMIVIDYLTGFVILLMITFN